MKHILTLLFLVTLSCTVFAQSPNKISYQAIVRAQDNTLVTSKNIGVQIIIHQSTASGTKVYQETHTVTSNSNGLITLEIGTGNVVSGSFSSIAWQNGPYFIETQIDPAGGSSYSIIGVTQLLSVPYALHAKTAESIVGNSTTATSTTIYKAAIISFASSRNIASTDINNTLECTSSATLTLTASFATMLIGDTINLEAHNGAVLTVQAASGVSINYKASGSAKFTSAAGNVRFGFLRKISANSYIISGQ